MAATDVERLAVLIEANTRSYERAMARIESRTQQAMRRSTQQVQTLDRQMVAAAATARRFLAAFGITLGIGGLFQLQRSVRGIVSEISELGKQARTVGLTAEEFQALRHSMGLAGVEANQFGRGMESFVQRLGQAADRGNELGRVLESHGVALRNSRGEMRSTLDLLRDFADLVARAESKQEAMNLAAVAFGDRAGRQMVRALRDGSAGIDDMIRAAREAGVVLDEDLVSAAERVDDRFAELTARIGTAFKSAVLSAVDAVDQLLERFRSLDRRTMIEPLRRELVAIGQERLQIERSMAELQSRLRDPARRAMMGLSVADIGAQQRRAQERLAALDERAQALLARLGELEERGARRPALLAGDGDVGRDRATIATREQRDAAAELIRELEHELRLLGMSEESRRVENALRQAGAEATEEQRTRIEALVRELHAAEEAARQAEEAFDFLRFAAFRALDDLIVRGDRASDVVRRLADQLARAALQATLLGEGPLARVLGTAGTGGLLGQAFAGLFAQGGQIGAGQWGIVGERGPEIVRGPAIVEPVRRANDNLPLRSERPVNVVVNIQTPHPEAFRQSQGQITAALARAVARGNRGL